LLKFNENQSMVARLLTEMKSWMNLRGKGVIDKQIEQVMVPPFSPEHPHYADSGSS
jgi:hypothetical protein